MLIYSLKFKELKLLYRSEVLFFQREEKLIGLCYNAACLMQYKKNCDMSGFLAVIKP
jgi:hypothetical protein